MDEERLLILKMIQEGKITAEEGAALLDALDKNEKDAGGADRADTGKTERKGGSIYTGPAGDSSGQSEEGSRQEGEATSWKEKLEKEASHFGRDVEKAVEKLTDTIEERLEKEIKPALANIPNVLSQIPFLGGLTGQMEKFSREVVGEFGPADEVDLDFATRTGSVQIELWDQPGYRVVLEGKLLGKDESEALTRADEVISIKQEQDRLHINSEARGGESVRIKAFLPRKHRYKCRTVTSTGRIDVNNIECSSLNCRAANGTIRLQDVAAGDLGVQAANGLVDLQKVKVQNLTGSTANGRFNVTGQVGRVRLHTANGGIRVRPTGNTAGEATDLDLETVNGRILVELPAEFASRCRLDLKSHSNAIDVSLPNLQYEVDEARSSERRIVARGSEFVPGVGVEIASRTMRGLIKVKQVERNED